jgi:hypothetical protein
LRIRRAAAITGLRRQNASLRSDVRPIIDRNGVMNDELVSP